MRVRYKGTVVFYLTVVAAIFSILGLSCLPASGAHGSHGPTVILKNKATSSTAWVTNTPAVSGTNVVQVIVNDSLRNGNPNQVEDISVTLQNPSLGSSVTVVASEVNPVTICGLPSGTTQPPDSPCFLAEVSVVGVNPGAGEIVGLQGNNLTVDYTPAGEPAIHPTISVELNVDTVKPSITGTSPLHNAEMHIQDITFSGQVADTNSGLPTPATALTLDHLKIDVFGQDGNTLINTFGPIQMTLTPITDGWRFDVATILAFGEYRWQITAMDNAGNQMKSDADPNTAGDQKFRLTLQSPIPIPPGRLSLREIIALFPRLNELVKAEITLHRDAQMVMVTAVAGTVIANSGNTLTIEPRDGSASFDLTVPEGLDILKDNRRILIAEVQVNHRVVVLHEDDILRGILVAPFHVPPPDRLVSVNGNNNVTIIITGDNNELEMKDTKTKRGGHPFIDDRGNNNVVIIEDDGNDKERHGDDDNHKGGRHSDDDDDDD